jgi:metal-responsive CopG/Arc/MetJ family transcriptional regulator
MNGLNDDDNDKTEKLGITLPKPILHRLDQVHGDIHRNRYIRRAIERYLGTSRLKKRREDKSKK